MHNMQSQIAAVRTGDRFVIIKWDPSDRIFRSQEDRRREYYIYDCITFFILTFF